MSELVEYVVCRLDGNARKCLFYAPAYSGFKKGDEVLVDTKPRAQRATVLAGCTTSRDDVEKALRIFAGEGDKPLKRVIGKYQFVKFDYSEDENNG